MSKNTRSRSREKEEKKKEHIVLRVGRGVYYILGAFFEALGKDFPENVRKRYAKPRNEYVEVKVPRGDRDTKAGPEYKDLSQNKEFSDFGGLPGFP